MSAHAEAPEAARRLADLRALLVREIAAAGGAVDFARFMELALYAPGLGYYAAAGRAPGAGGDFTTAPEMAGGTVPVLAHAIAALVAPALRADEGLGLVEAGPGSGRLAADVLAALATRHGVLPKRYLLVERAAALADLQRERVAALPPALRAVVAFAELLPERLTDIVIANELLDALPTHRFRLEGSSADVTAKEMVVSLQGDELVWRTAAPVTRPVADALDALRAVPHVGPLPSDYEGELCLAARQWTADTARRLDAGALLLLDYGYRTAELYHPERRRGTLRCFRDHVAHDDPLAAPGRDDITAHVDFTSVAAAGTSAGLRQAGFCTQADFVVGSGVLQAIEAECAARQAPPPPALAAQLRQLLLPGEMGELVKVLLLDRETGLTLSGRQRPL